MAKSKKVLKPFVTFPLKLNPSRHARLKRLAKRNDVTLHELVSTAVNRL